MNEQKFKTGGGGDGRARAAAVASPNANIIFVFEASRCVGLAKMGWVGPLRCPPHEDWDGGGVGSGVEPGWGRDGCPPSQERFRLMVSRIMCHHSRLPPPICQLLPHNRPCTTTTSAPCARTSPIFGGLVIAIDKQEVNLVTDDEELLIICFIESNALLVRVGRCSPRLLVRMVSQITCRLGSDGVVVSQALLLL